MKLQPSAVRSTALALRGTPLRLAALALALQLAGCTLLGDGLFGGDKVDYRNNKAAAKPLEVPPDLTQLSRESRYQPQGGVVSAAAAAGATPNAPGAGTAGAPGTAAAAAGTAAPATVALAAQGSARIERAGQQRWLVVGQTPEQLWPQLQAFWDQRGFTLEENNPQIGVMETTWSENRAKLPADAVRNTIGRVLGNLYDTGERDRFRTRVERTPAGSEVYISHRGAEEVLANERRDTTVWRARPNDPELEAEFLSRLMVALGTPETTARAAVAGAASAPAVAGAMAGAGTPRGAAPTMGTATSIVVNEPFDRSWRRVGLALDRSGFTVEDRDRAAGLYYVRYVDPRNVGKEEPGFWSRLFGNTVNPLAAQRYRIALKTADGKTTVSVQNATGAPEAGENAQRIVSLLGNELR